MAESANSASNWKDRLKGTSEKFKKAASDKFRDVNEQISQKKEELSQKYGKGGKKKIFGVPLDNVPGDIPQVMTSTIEFFYKNGVEVEGLFRLSARQNEIVEMRKRIDRGEEFETFDDVHLAAGLLKLFLRDLPEPLLTFELYDCFLAAVAVECDLEAKLQKVSQIFTFLSERRRNIISYLLKFLKYVSTFSDTNKMTVVNLAIVFSPTLLRPLVEGDQQAVLEDYTFSNKLLELCVTHYEKLWVLVQKTCGGTNIQDEADEKRQIRKSKALHEARQSLYISNITPPHQAAFNKPRPKGIAPHTFAATRKMRSNTADGPQFKPKPKAKPKAKAASHIGQQRGAGAKRKPLARTFSNNGPSGKPYRRASGGVVGKPPALQKSGSTGRASPLMRTGSTGVAAKPKFPPGQQHPKAKPKAKCKSRPFNPRAQTATHPGYAHAKTAPASARSPSPSLRVISPKRKACSKLAPVQVTPKPSVQPGRKPVAKAQPLVRAFSDSHSSLQFESPPKLEREAMPSKSYTSMSTVAKKPMHRLLYKKHKEKKGEKASLLCDYC